jgi:hypothetical protein
MEARRKSWEGQAQRFAEGPQFHHVQSPLTTLNLADERLSLAKTIRKLLLC